MSYRLFLDDKREPPEGDDWVVARNAREFFDILDERGAPTHLDLDYYLNDDFPAFGPTGANLAMDFCSAVGMGELTLPEGFTFSAHSSDEAMNDRIRKAMTDGLRLAAVSKELHGADPDRSKPRKTYRKRGLVRH